MNNKLRLRVLGLLLVAIVCGAISAAAGQEQQPAPVRLRVAADQANLRERPDIGSAIVQQIPEGTVLEAEKKEGEWYLVRYTLEDGGVMAGWIHESLVVVIEGALPQPPIKETPPAGRPAPAAPAAKPGAAPSRAILPEPMPERRFELSVSPGLTRLEPRDLNNGAVGAAGFTAASYDTYYEGGVGKVTYSGSLSLDLSYRVSAWFAVGVGVDYYLARNKSILRFPEVVPSLNMTVRPGLTVTPVRLSARFYPARDFYLRGSLGYYHARASYLERLSGINILGTSTWEQWSGHASASGFGAEAGMGGEYDVKRDLTFFAEAGFRIVTVGSLKGLERYTNSDSEVIETSGTLYYFRQTGADGQGYHRVAVRESEPSGSDITSARKVEINLSGAYVQVGLRLRF
jgi:hypothetical protein